MAQRYLQGCIEVVQFDDRVTVDEVPALESLLSPSLGNRLPQLIFDLRKVRLIDSAGLELLVRVHSRCGSRGGALVVAAPSQHVRDVFHITGLDSILSMQRDVVSAAGVFAL